MFYFLEYSCVSVYIYIYIYICACVCVCVLCVCVCVCVCFVCVCFVCVCVCVCLFVRSFVHSFVRGGYFCTVWELGASFWVTGRHLRLHFGCSGSRLGTFLGALGVVWAPFWGLWGPLGSILEALGDPWLPLGVLGGALGRPRGPKSNFPNFFPPILGSFWLHFGGKNRSKI